MPYSSLRELPPNVRDQLSKSEQEQWLAVFNQVYAQTHDDGKAAAAAWGAVNKARGKARRAVKTRMTDDGKVIVEGWAMLFTNASNPDEHDEYFDRATKLLLNYYQGSPLWMEHGLDSAYGPDPIGRRHSAEVYGYGVWLGHELHPDHPRFAETKDGVDNGEFSYSSDSIKHYVAQGFDPQDGHLGVWPFAGCSLTRDPAEPGLGPVSIQAFKSLVAHHLLQSRLRSSIGEGHLEQLPPSEAREAQRRGRLPSFSQGGVMTPEMLAALAEFLGVEATPEAVAAALQDLLTQLNTAPAAGADQQQQEMMTSLRSALSLPEAADKAEITAKLNDIVKMLAEPAPAGRSLNFDALKRFHGLVEETLEEPDEDQDEPPFQTRSNHGPNQPRRSATNINKGAKKPGIVQMLRDIHPQMPTSMKSAKAQSYQVGPTGGYILNHEVVAEFLPALRDALPLYDMGAQQYDMDGVESLTIPKDKDEQEAYWVGEDTDIPESEDKVGGVILFARPIAARVRVPNKFLTNSIVDYEARVREKIEYRISRAIMRAALYGSGGVSSPNPGAQPLGLKTLAGMTGRNVTVTSLGTNGATPKLKNLTDAYGRIEDANVELDESTSILFAPRSKRTFADMTDTNGQPLLRGSWAEREEREVAGYPWDTTNLISITETVGSSSDCSTWFVGVWKHLALGISNQFEFLIDPYSQSSKLMTVIIAYTYADVAVLYDEAFEIVTGVRP